MKPGKLLIVGLCYVVSWGHGNPLAQAEIDQSILPAMFQTPWDPGIPGGIPADDDPTRPASVWLPDGDPYHGYYYRILTRQGAKAPGGEHDYVVNGKMIGGFALVAWPAKSLAPAITVTCPDSVAVYLYQVSRRGAHPPGLE